MTVKKITAVLFVEEVEPCATFWVDRLGFKKTAEVPEGNKLAFAMLQKGNVELMYQSYASADKESAATGEAARKGITFLYVEVDDLNQIIRAIKGVEIVTQVHETFYGAKEISVRDPGGHLVTFAQFSGAKQ